jgi:hypothetical protein
MFRQVLKVSSVLIASLTAAASGAAEADTWIPRAQRSRVAFEIDSMSSHGHRYGLYRSFTFGLVGQIAFARRAYLDVDVPWAFGSFTYGPFSFGVFRWNLLSMGSPAVGAHWADRVGHRWAFHAGGTVSIPSLMMETDIQSVMMESDMQGELPAAVALRLRSLMDLTSMPRDVANQNRAYADQQRFMYGRVGLRARAGLELRILPVLYYHADFSALVGIPLGGLESDTDLLFEIHNEVVARAPMGLGGGLHAQAVLDPTDPEDKAKLAIEPYASYEPRRGLYTRLGLLVPLDAPPPEAQGGFTIEQRKAPTVRVAMGGSW